MSKWKCNKAAGNCIVACCVELDTEEFGPPQGRCVFDYTRQAVWERVTEEQERVEQESVQLPKMTANVFDSSDWKNSLIKRPAKLPDWCKVGAIGFEDEYFKIIKINDKSCDVQYLDPHMQDEDGNIGGITFDCLRQCHEARLRPYNADEMRGLVGKAIERHSSAYLVISYAHDDLETTVYIEGKYLSADNLLRDFTICP